MYTHLLCPREIHRRRKEKMAEYTLSMLAKEFETSKDVMKYHRKNLPESVIRKDEKGVVWISETGKAIIQGKLRKEKYRPNFEEEVLLGLRRLEWLLDHTGSHQGKTEVSSRESVSVLEKIRAYEQKDIQSPQEVDWQNTLTQEEHEREVDILEAEIKKYKSLYEGLKADIVALSSSTIIHADGRLQLNFEQYKKVVRLFPSEIKDDERR